MNEVKLNETIENIIFTLMLTGIIPMIAATLLIGFFAWVIL